MSTVSLPVGASTTTHDTAGNAGPVVGGVTLATPRYDTAGRLDWVEYANGTKRSMEHLLRLLEQSTLLKSVAAPADLNCLRVPWLRDPPIPILNPGAFVGRLVRC